MAQPGSSHEEGELQHVQLDDGKQPESSAADAPAPPADAPPAVAPAPAPAAPPSSPPPAMAALESVLGFFSSVSHTVADTVAGTAPAQQAAARADAAEPAGGEGPAAPAAAQAAGAAGEGPEQQEGEGGSYDAVAAFEQEVGEAAERLQHGVEEVSQKLLHASAEAKESLASLAQGLSSWWSKLDGPAEGGAAGGGSRPRALDAAAAGAQLGLEAGETVLECFACRLWQTYTATNNFFTPVRQVPFPGSLVVTSQRLCFAFEEPGLAPARVPAKALKVAAKLPADEDKGLPARLEVALRSAGQSLVLADFALAELELDSALALVEHLAEGAQE